MRINVQIFNRHKQFTVFLRQSSIKKAADVPSKTKTQANSLVRLGYDVCVRQNLVFRAIFESVLDDKYFFAVFSFSSPCINTRYHARVDKL